MNTIKILLVEDSESDATLLLREIRKGGFEPVCSRVDTASDMNKALEREDWDIIISDHLMPTFSSSEALKLLRSKGIDVPFIIVSGQIGEEAAVEAMKAGADDYLMKGNLQRLAPAIQREIRDAQARRSKTECEAELIAEEEESRRKHSRHLKIMQRLPMYLSEAKDFDDMMRKALNYILKTMRVSSGVLFLGDLFNLRAHIGVSREFAEILNKTLERTKLERAAKDGVPAGGQKSIQDNIEVIDTHKLGFRSENAHFVISIPLKSADRVMAIVMLPSSGKRIPSKEEKELLNAMGSHIGTAIENALLLKRMDQLSVTDELTKLFNRRRFYQVLENEISRAQRYQRPLTLVFLDIDKFKDYNDRFGHPGGDRALISLAEAMTKYLRKTDIPFRIGGDEFAIILPETDAYSARGVIERMRWGWAQAAEAEFRGLENIPGVSAGIAEFPKDAEGQEKLVFTADAALYASKGRGGNRATMAGEMEGVGVVISNRL